MGPDGALWFVEKFGNNIGRITTNGTITEYPIPTARSAPWAIGPGPDGGLWFTEAATNKIGRLQPPIFPNSHDINADGYSDIVWQDTSRNTAVWLMNGASVMSAAGLGQITGWSIVGQRDFNGDGDSDLLWRDGSGDTALYLMNGTTVTSALSLGNVPTVVERRRSG